MFDRCGTEEPEASILGLLLLPNALYKCSSSAIADEASSRKSNGWNNVTGHVHKQREVCVILECFCRWGDACRFLHDSSRSSGTPRNSNNSTTHRTTQGTLPMHAGSQSGGLNVSQQQQRYNCLLSQQTMLAQFGFKLAYQAISAHSSTRLKSGNSRPTSLQPTTAGASLGIVQGSTPAIWSSNALPQAV
ncbi:hypothetical protein Tco_1430779 [Tanacetum coccineum]